MTRGFFLCLTGMVLISFCIVSTPLRAAGNGSQIGNVDPATVSLPDGVNEPNPNASLPHEVAQINETPVDSGPTQDEMNSFLWNYLGIDFTGMDVSSIDSKAPKHFVAFQFSKKLPKEANAWVRIRLCLGTFVLIFLFFVFLGAWLLSFRRRWMRGYFPATGTGIKL